MVEKFRLRPFGTDSWMLTVVLSVPFGLILGVIMSNGSPTRFALIFLGGAIGWALLTGLTSRFSWHAALHPDELRVNVGGRGPELRIPYGAIERVLWDDRQAAVFYRGDTLFGDKVVTRTVKLHVDAPQVFADRLTYAIERAELNPEAVSSRNLSGNMAKAVVIGVAIVAVIVIAVSLLG